SWFFFSGRRRHTRFSRDWSSDVCSSDLVRAAVPAGVAGIVIRHKAGNLVIRQSDGSAELTVRATAWPGGFGGDPREIVRNIRVEIGRASCRGKAKGSAGVMK